MNPAAKLLCKEVYIAARTEAARRGMAKEEFDARFKASGLTQEKLGRIIAICTMTPAELSHRMHVMFAIINCADSPVVRDGMLNELAEEFLTNRQLVDAEWAHWASKNSRATVDQLAADAVKELQESVDRYFESLPKLTDQ